MRRVSNGALDLSSYLSVRANAQDVVDAVSTGYMPPGAPWPASDVAVLSGWMTRGCPEGPKLDLGPTPDEERDLFYHITHLDDHLDYLPTAMAYARRYLALIHSIQDDLEHSTDPEDALSKRFFYTPESFSERLDAVYAADLAKVEAYRQHPELDPRYVSRDKLVQWLIQWAPFSFFDGGWLRNIHRGGPIDRVHAHLFSILMDETGDGDVLKNHCNIYQDLMHRLDADMPDFRSADFPKWNFVPRAFRVTAFEMAVGQFPDTFFPELLGMTVQLEWTINLYRNNSLAMEHHGIDSFYFSLHVGIDNPVNGHGHLAKQAVLEQMESLRLQGLSEEALQAYWQRIWSGYIGFERLGAAFDAEMTAAMTTSPNYTDQVVRMIMQKAPYACQNHPHVMIAGVPLNDLFATPTQLLPLLVQEGFIIPGKPEESPFLDLMSFHGPMLQVFSADEQTLWGDYIRSLSPSSATSTGLSSTSSSSPTTTAPATVYLRQLGRRGRHGCFLV